MARVIRKSQSRDEVLRRLREGDVQVKGGLWTQAWIELIEQGVSEEEAKAFFDEVSNTVHPSGGYAYKARASEGRRAFSFGQQDRDEALHLLRTCGYHEAIKGMPTITDRGAKRSASRALRLAIGELVAALSDSELVKLLDELKGRASKAKRQ